MEALQKLPIVRMMTRSPTSPVNSNSNLNPDPNLPPRTPPPPPEPVYETTPITSPRSLRQLSIFWVGAGCFLASTAITRRAVHRRILRVKPKFYEPNTNPHEHFSPFHDAIQAMNLATMNCISLATMGVGGTLWAFDISGLKEAQDALRGRLNYEAVYQSGEAPPESIVDLLKASRETMITEKREEGAEEDKNGNDTPR